MELTPKQRLLLFAAHLNADSPVSVLVKKTGLPKHTIHYHLKKFRSMGLIRRLPMVNFQSFGYIYCELFISARDDRSRELIESALTHSEYVTWFGVSRGAYDFDVLFCLPTLDAVAEFLSSLTAKTGAYIERKSLLLLTSHSVFSKNHLLGISEAKPRRSLELLQKNSERMTEIDFQIMARVFDPDCESQCEIARAIGLPRSTVDYRLARLIDRGVYMGSIYSFNAQLIGLQYGRVCLRAHRYSADLTQRLQRFTLADERIVNFSSTIGESDYVLGVEVRNIESLHQLEAKLLEAFPGELSCSNHLLIAREGYSARCFASQGLTSETHSNATQQMVANS